MKITVWIIFIALFMAFILFVYCLCKARSENFTEDDEQEMYLLKWKEEHGREI